MNRINATTSQPIAASNSTDISAPHADMLFWATSYLHQSNIRHRKQMTAQNKQNFVDLAYDYYSAKLIKHHESPSIADCQNKLEHIAIVADKHKDSIQTVIFDDDQNPYNIEDSSEYPVYNHLLQGPWFFYNKDEYINPNNNYNARFSINVSDSGYKPLIELITKLMSPEHPLNKAIIRAKVYGPYFLGKSPEMGIIYLNPAEMTDSNKDLMIAELKTLDEYARTLPLGMQQVTASAAYGEIPLDTDTTSFGTYRSKIIADAVNDFISEKFNSLEQALQANYEKYGLNPENPALCNK